MDYPSPVIMLLPPLLSIAHVITSIHWPPTFQHHTRTMKMSPNNVQWHCLGLGMFFFFKIFFYLFLPPQQHRPHRHHSPLTSYSPKSHQKHKTSPNDVQWHCLGYKYVFFSVFFFYLFIPFFISLVAPLHQGSLIYYSWLVN